MLTTIRRILRLAKLEPRWTATVLMAFTRNTLTLPDDSQVYLMDVSTIDPLPGVDHWRIENGAFVYRAWTRTQPTIFQNGQPVTLATEIGPGSTVRLALHQNGSHIVLDGVELVDHRVVNPFE